MSFLLDALKRVVRHEDGRAYILGLSGGKDSTALALRMKELHPDQPMNYICTPTGDELPEMEAHWHNLEVILGRPIIHLRAPSPGSDGPLTLNTLIEHFGALPNFRQRWCTRMLKIQPTEAFMRALGPAVMFVGLRADEESRQGLFAEDIQVSFPMRAWGWAESDVWDYLNKRGVSIPRRTDCARCYHQRLIEWKILAEQYSDLYDEAVGQEESTNHTFRSPGRDKWPVDLRNLRIEFESGRPLRGESAYRERLAAGESPCRVCSL